MPQAGRPRKIKNELFGRTVEEQVRLDDYIKENAPDDGFVPLTHLLYHKILSMPRREQEKTLKELAEVEFDRCAKDPLYWLDGRLHAPVYAKTLDPRPLFTCNICGPDYNDFTYGSPRLQFHLAHKHKMDTKTRNDALEHFSEINPIRPFVVKEYFKPLVEVWLNEQLIAVQKTRDMMATWIFSAIFTWDVLFHEGRQHVFQSEDRSKTKELVQKRAFFLWYNQPPWLKNYHKAFYLAGDQKSGELTIPSLNSEIIGLPAGEDQIRYLHPAGVFMDEAAFHPNVESTLGAIRPSIQAGGKIVMLSSANPGFFQRICEDTIDN